LQLHRRDEWQSEMPETTTSQGCTSRSVTGFGIFRETAFTKVLCNPPYHCDFSVAKHLIEKSFNRLLVGGAVWMVTKRDTWYRKKLTSVFGGVRVIARNTYFVFEARKKSLTYASRIPTSR
jgi:16S rRNA (guanine1207-N2)-methyltransferase